MFEIANEEQVESHKESQELPIDYLDVLKNKNILLVEDVKINQLITKKTLTKKEMICDAVDNGTDAISKAKEGGYDLILMDIHMPGISGLEATKAIRMCDKTTPLIALTAITIEREEEDEFNSVGFNDILSKPFKTDVFFEKIYTHINKS